MIFIIITADSLEASQVAQIDGRHKLVIIMTASSRYDGKPLVMVVILLIPSLPLACSTRLYYRFVSNCQEKIYP